MKNTLTLIASLLALGIAVLALAPSVSVKNVGGGFETDTTNTGYTSATSTINTTSTQIAASVTSTLTLFNRSTSTFTCKPDDQGTTVGSSTVAAGQGIIIGPQLSTGANIPAQASFGNCTLGMYNCFPFKGTLNCVADVAALVTKVSR